MTFSTPQDVEMYAVTGLTTAISTLKGLKTAPTYDLAQHIGMILEVEDLVAELRQRLEEREPLKVGAHLAGQVA